jgi:uncharacterized protein YjaZ
MTPETFVSLVDLDLFSLIFGLGAFSWAAGYAVGYVLMMVRKLTHMST